MKSIVLFTVLFIGCAYGISDDVREEEHGVIYPHQGYQVEADAGVLQSTIQSDACVPQIVYFNPNIHKQNINDNGCPLIIYLFPNSNPPREEQ